MNLGPVHILRFLCCLLLALACTATRAQQVREWWNLKLDPRAWILNRESAGREQGERVYALQGENAYFWTELVTTGYLTTGALPDDYILGFINDLADNCRPLKVAPIEQTPTSVIFEWEGDCRVVGPQAEIRRVAIRQGSVHYLAYSAKPTRLTLEKKALWLAIIRDATLK